MSEEEKKPEQGTDTAPAPVEDKGNYFVYGMAVGLIIGIVFLYLFNSKLLMSICVFIGMVVGYCIKRK